MFDGLLVNLISEGVFRAEIAHLLEFVTYSSQLRDVVIVIAPECDALVLLSHWENSTIDKLVAIVVEQPADHVHE